MAREAARTLLISAVAGLQGPLYQGYALAPIAFVRNATFQFHAADQAKRARRAAMRKLRAELAALSHSSSQG
jgi:hypothetical protein